MISESRQDSRSLVSPLEQVGEHSGGAGNWRARGESWGIDAGVQLGELVAQLARSGSSSVSISAGFLDLLSSMDLHLLSRIDAALFFYAGIPLGLHLDRLPLALGSIITPRVRPVVEGHERQQSNQYRPVPLEQRPDGDHGAYSACALA